MRTGDINMFTREVQATGPTGDDSLLPVFSAQVDTKCAVLE